MSLQWAIFDLIPLLTLITHIAIALFFIGLGIFYKSNKKRYKQTINFLKENSFILSLIFATSGFLGSLFYSEIMNLTPCPLCWYQRIMLYPQVVICLLALKNKSRDVAKSLLALSSIGFVIALFHYITQFFSIATSCAVGEVDCSVKLIFHFGYVTIPLMAATAFIIIILLQIVKLQERR